MRCLQMGHNAASKKIQPKGIDLDGIGSIQNCLFPK